MPQDVKCFTPERATDGQQERQPAWELSTASQNTHEAASQLEFDKSSHKNDSMSMPSIHQPPGKLDYLDEAFGPFSFLMAPFNWIFGLLEDFNNGLRTEIPPAEAQSIGSISESLNPPDYLLMDSQGSMYFNHFIHHTARLLVAHECSDNPFKTILPQSEFAKLSQIYPLAAEFIQPDNISMIGDLSPRFGIIADV